MINKLTERLLAGIIIVIAVGIVVHAPLTVWLGTVLPDANEVVKAWKELLMGLGLVLLIVMALRQKMAKTLLNDRVMQLALGFALLHFVLIVGFRSDVYAASAGILIDLRFVLYFVLVYGLLRMSPSWQPLLIKVFIYGAVVVVVFGLLQIFVLPKDILSHIGYGEQTIMPYLTVDKNPDYIRINSTLRGPNPLGAYCVIILSIIAAYALRFGKKLQSSHKALLAIGAIGTVLVLISTYSRSSAIAAVVGLAVVILVGTTGKVRKLILASLAVGVVAASIFVVAFRDSSFVANVILHNNPTTGGSIDSNEGHAQSLAEGIERLTTQPFGAGIGSTGSASLNSDDAIIIENHYLFVAHEVGWLGLGIFVWLFGEVMYRLWQRKDTYLGLGVFAAGSGLAVIALLLPVWTDDTVSIIWWGLAATAIAINGKVQQHGKRKSN